MCYSRYENQKHVREEVERILNENGIKYIIIKGYTLAKYYYYEYLRFSSDIDIVVKKEDYYLARDLLVSSGTFTITKYGQCELSLQTNNKVDVDLHWTFSRYDDEINEIYKDVDFDNTNHELNNEYKLFHLYNHGAKHFYAGFVSFQLLIDIYYLRKEAINHDVLNELVTKAKLNNFVELVNKVEDTMFYGKQADEETKLFINYLFDESFYKGTENSIKNIRINKKMNKIFYILFRFFPDPKTMREKYPEALDIIGSLQVFL